MNTVRDLETKTKVVSALLKELHVGKSAWEALAPLFRPPVTEKEGAGWEHWKHRE